MQSALKPLMPILYSALRFVAGLLFVQHGLQKLFGILGARAAQPLFSQMGLAGLVETIGGSLIALGLFTPWAAFVASGQMAWAYFQQHAPRGFFPIQNGGELAALYCFLFLYIAANGSGLVSLDTLRGKRRS